MEPEEPALDLQGLHSPALREQERGQWLVDEERAVRRKAQDCADDPLGDSPGLALRKTETATAIGESPPCQQVIGSLAQEPLRAPHGLLHPTSRDEHVVPMAKGNEVGRVEREGPIDRIQSLRHRPGHPVGEGQAMQVLRVSRLTIPGRLKLRHGTGGVPFAKGHPPIQVAPDRV